MAGQKHKKNTDEETVNIDVTDITIESEDVEENMCEEYYVLNSQLDELTSALDVLEKRTDDITKKVKELLQSNIEIRKELKNEQLESDEKV